MKKLKILSIVGTRPEIIRLSEIIKKLDKFTNNVLVNTGQNFNYNLSKFFFKDLDLRKPNYEIKNRSKNLHQQISYIINGVGTIIEKVKPDAFIVLGDTNSSLSLIVAKRMGIPTFHLEAGDRCFDNNNPEEVNRKIVDHISDYNFTYTENSRRNLIREGIHPDKVFLMGSPVKEVYDKIFYKIYKSNILKKLKLEKNNFFAASIHREETVDNIINFNNLINSFDTISKKYKIPIVISTHPRTMRKVKKIGHKNKLVIWHEPFGLIDYLSLQTNSKCVISDSGTIQEDATILNFPAVTLRNSTEKKEAIEKGIAVISGYTSDAILDQIRLTLDYKTTNYPKEYMFDDVSTNVVKLILGLVSSKKNLIG